MHDIRPFIERVKRIVDEHYLGEPGKYKRWLAQDEKGSRDLGASPYGCANAVNILYTIGELPHDLKEREAFIRVLQDFQDQESGLFHNEGNFETHTTAFVSGALNLLDAKPLYKADGFSKYRSKEGLFAFMDEINWSKEPWLGAHLGAGIYGSMILTDSVDDDWEDLYFEWLDENADPMTGLWKRGSLSGAPLFHYLASSFHYVFNYEYARRALPYPNQLLNTCIKAYREGACMDFAKEIGWPDIDFPYLLAKAQSRSGEKFGETKEILSEIADGLIAQLQCFVADQNPAQSVDSDLSLNPAADPAKRKKINEALNDLNTLFAIVSALALLQEALPGYIRTSKPLKLVLNKRPFL